ncbi:sulfate/molybdate ABC transporter ATP-binding protein [Lawsonibacter celer]|uniref:sulfate/molybdate ABC transporter ATP-binding protein n=1 Tax=Lawsonibacter celer TaxID=2986526 RepID=UPI0016491DA7|nr:ATP-binding cassette domain-containing protein [Lawsonibacter celer]
MSLLVEIQKDLGPFRLEVGFEARDGVTGVLGASGCGKSLTLKCIAGVESPDAGHIELDGRVLFDRKKRVNLPPQRRHVGYLFQNYALFPNMTVEQNIAAGVRDRAARPAAVAQMTAAFHLEECLGKYPRQLSGGQQQRVALARILASQPEALLLDEPFSALDSYLKWQVELELMERLEAFSGPVLFVTHSRDEVYRQCREVCVLSDGKSQPVQPVSALFDAPFTLSACRLSGCKNFSRARLLPDGRLEAVDWGLSLSLPAPPVAETAWVGIRAHFLRPADGPGENRLECRVVRVVEELFSTTVMLAAPGSSGELSLLRMELPKAEWAALGHPEALWVELPARDLMPLRDG